MTSVVIYLQVTVKHPETENVLPVLRRVPRNRPNIVLPYTDQSPTTGLSRPLPPRIFLSVDRLEFSELVGDLVGISPGALLLLSVALAVVVSSGIVATAVFVPGRLLRLGASSHSMTHWDKVSIFL